MQYSLRFDAVALAQHHSSAAHEYIKVPPNAFSGRTMLFTLVTKSLGSLRGKYSSVQGPENHVGGDTSHPCSRWFITVYIRIMSQRDDDYHHFRSFSKRRLMTLRKWYRPTWYYVLSVLRPFAVCCTVATCPFLWASYWWSYISRNKRSYFNARCWQQGYVLKLLQWMWRLSI